MTSPGNLSVFSRNLWLTLAVFVVFSLAFVVYVYSEKQIDRANELRLQSFFLADELRQSSDDLTRMVRSYVITGDTIYKQHYQEILDIRDGKKPRPIDYQDVYWDLVLADDKRPRPNGQAISLLELMRQAGFTEEEFAKLAQAKANSDTLTRTEFDAMNLVESTNPATEANRFKASMMLHDAAYHQAKSAIMRPISELMHMFDQRTLAAVHTIETYAMLLRVAFISFGILLLLMLRRAYCALCDALGGSVEEVHGRIARLGCGDFSSAIPVAKGMENSVLGWLSETRARLARMDDERKAVEAKNQRLTQLYAALSQCNQAIVRCTSETELFPQICSDVVIFGKIQMAWIGLLDEQSRELKPAAFYGSGADYLEDIHISIDENSVSGRGPTGTAMREDRPFWCQDFQHDPATAPWHERGAKFNWGASAALPLHRNGAVIGAFTLYAAEVNAFDEAERNLLVEMAMDIDYALYSFERETERQQAQQMENFRSFMFERLTSGASLMEILADVVRKLETIISGSYCSILLLDDDGRHLRQGAAPSLPDFYNAAIDGLPIGPGVGACGNAAFTGKRTIIEDAAHHPYWAAFKSLSDRVGLGACWSEPVLSAGNKVLGTFAIYHCKPSAPDSHTLQLLEMVAHFVAIAIERKKSEERIQYLANFDSLTGLPNRIQLDTRFNYAIGLAKCGNGHLALMFLDLDHFKDINDTLGHSVGDALLIELAKRLSRVLREGDTLSRLGGDEFILLLPGTNAAHAAQVAQVILNTIAKPHQIGDYNMTLTASIGIAVYPDDGDDLESLSKSADNAMYRAKREGRHGFRFFTQEMQAHSVRNMQIVNALRQAQEQNQLQVYYQPQVSMPDGRLIGAEALLRWRHPVLGMVSPGEFIPIAEENGLILSIGEWVLRQAVLQAKTWMNNGYTPLIMAVNLSAVQFRHPDLPALVSCILDDEGLPPEYLELELTESVAMHNPLGAIAVMSNLHERGIRMSIDDFGTGYSSLSYLKQFKVYKLKIDQSFVRNITTDPEDKAIVCAVISLAKSLGLKTIAEGVETAEQLGFLREQGCDEAQGYLFSKPVSAEQFEALLKQEAQRRL